MLQQVISNFQTQFNLAQSHLPFLIQIIAIAWIIHAINHLLQYRLNIFGILPRTLWGLIGIVFSPVLHGNFNHLFFNTIPFFVLGAFMLSLGKETFIASSIMIALIEGGIVWIIGRRNFHVGASGIIAGYFGFILAIAYIAPTLTSLILAAVAIYYFGSIIAGVFPTSELISWECHLTGLLAGIISMYLLVYRQDFRSWIMSFF